MGRWLVGQRRCPYVRPVAFVTCERRPPVRFARLDTGPMNVLGTPAVRELRSLLTEDDEEAPVVLLSGRAEAFSAGLDLATLARGGAESQELLVEMGELLVGVYAGPTRLVVACTGHAVAAGAMLLLVADVRVGAQGRYKVGFSEPSQGMPLPELPVRLARDRLDPRFFQAATLLGRLSAPDAALEMGFLDEVVPGERVEVVASERAHELAALSDAVYRGTLASVRGETLRRLEELLRAERKRLEELRSGAA